MIPFQELQREAADSRVSPALMLAEIVQVSFLDAFYRLKESNTVHLQGGTSIRMLHKGWRY